MDLRLQAFERLLNIMDDLRAKCPWDQKQTFETLRQLTIEETYELADAISNQDMESIKGEIGDLFLHLVFYAKLGEEKGDFNVTTILNQICDKLIYRHPHIYGDVKVQNEEEVKANWEKLKLKEGKKSVLEGVPVSLPALVKATRIQEKVKGIGFEWDNREDVWKKVEEELAEFKAEVDAASDNIEEEFGDLLFSLVNYSRFIDVSPENALAKTNNKFINRFRLMEELIQQDALDIHEMNLTEMDEYWEKSENFNQKQMTELEVQIIETIILGAILIGIKIFTQKSINKFLSKFDFDLKRKRITQRIINLFLTILALVILAGIWNIKRSELMVFLTSVITVLGIAFFAQWSILSNITSSLILFFNHPLKIGQNVRVLEKDYDVEGQLIDISFFFMYVRDKDGNTITIPTSVVLQKTIVSKKNA